MINIFSYKNFINRFFNRETLSHKALKTEMPMLQELKYYGRFLFNMHYIQFWIPDVGSGVVELPKKGIRNAMAATTTPRHTLVVSEAVSSAYFFLSSCRVCASFGPPERFT